MDGALRKRTARAVCVYSTFSVHVRPQMRDCWMCGDPATTGEHKVKRTDLERVHGRADAFRSANLNYLRSDASVVPLQGPNSKHVKYHRVLCGPCNSTRSQPFDHAYDTFAQYVEDRSDVLLSRRQIDFASVYGNGWREGQVNLFKYFVKALGCRIADAGKSVPNDLINFFKDRYPEKPLAICFSVRRRRNCQTQASTDETGYRSPCALRRIGRGDTIC